MARQNAKNLVLKIETSEGSGSFTSLGMLQSADFSVSPQSQSVTNKDSNDWEEKDVTTLQISASGAGFYDAGAGWNRLRAAILNREKPKMQIVDPGDGTYEGRFIVSLGKSGGSSGSVEANTSLESAGEITHTPV